MKKLIKLLSKSGIVGIGLVTGVMLVYAVGNLINSVTIQTINKGDQIGSGWFQDVNDKLINVEIYSGAGIASKYMRGNQKVCIEDDCRTNWPSSGSSVWSTGTNKIYYQGGNVGIGTIEPQVEFHIEGDTPDSRIVNTNSNGYTQMEFYENSTRQAYINVIGSNRSNTEEQNDLQIGTDNGDITLEPNGNVGIGTTTPDETLDIAYGHAIFDNTYGLKFQNSTGDIAGRMKVNSMGRVVMDNGSNDQITIDTNDDVWLVRNSGNVGVGTTSPSRILEVSRGGAANAMFTNTNTGGESWSFLLGDNGLGMNGDFSIGYSDPGNGIAGGDHVNVITLQNNANIGIGTTSPSYTLQVGESGDGTEARANSWNTFSDKRLKTNLKVLTGALGKIEKLNGYYYNWKTGSDISKQFGTLAQEVEKVLPEIVSQKGDGYKSLNYGKLTPLLIEAFKDLKQEKDKQINKQQKQINDLKKEIEKIKRKLK